ncbi:hypothetical protein ASH00_14695 [Arthrobacter sp. Soil782]|uniref:hypothetical protein n=1 Tax=Arthrobacter sp. Soil782 TaxID=1736410 RepID=UPI0006F6C33F|nr:hypothetical protein [Arthrobacter sp. Soil782]KRF04349.1 hypothetical protein ASH00_14695 [Arthrobacter sp. Soil782]
MEENDEKILDPVDGLVDAERVSKYLGVDKITLRSWVLRKKKGEARGIHDRFPDPRGTLGTSVVWRADAIVEFKQFYAERKGQKGAQRPKVVDLETAAEVTPLRAK